MSWWLSHNFDKKTSRLLERQRILKTVRRYFDDLAFEEVETPIFQSMPGADIHVHGIKVQVHDMDLFSKPIERYLHTSPELAMKKLLVAGVPKMYQLAKVFRDAEVTRLHNVEFTMLEWYRASADYTDLMDDCEALLKACAKEYSYNGVKCDPNKPWQKISVYEAFKQYVDMDLDDLLDDPIKFGLAAQQAGVRVTKTDGWDDVFYAVMAEKIEPFLGEGAPTILYDYPVSMACLARKSEKDPRFAERFELYVCGVELANAYSELTDPIEQRDRLGKDMSTKQRLYGDSYEIDMDFISALKQGMPESAGIALGFDRLVMLATDADHINQVQWCA